MSNEKIIEELTKDVLMLKREVERLSKLTPLYTILNINTPAQITATQNNYSIGDYDMLHLTSDASRTITGFTGGVLGRLLWVLNTGTNDIVLAHLSASSDAANRIFSPSLANITMQGTGAGSAGSVVLRWGGTNWRVLFRTVP